ncbi:hypothetical protein JOF29_001530 [Kribbella aluminosa]|uniref:Uncharacterized protein n=1 Tax=Kribbella aluminosa TaxID=416017 RepID=A0ABS4UFM6_9ACTN|nr:hypothetical protein [Kribbella aluminosa]
MERGVRIRRRYLRQVLGANAVPERGQSLASTPGENLA